MRIPQSWNDEGLLEDEPFLSAFKARQLAAPPTRRCAALAGGDDDDARNEEIVREIRDMKLVSFFIASTSYKQLHRPQLPTVQAWLNLAFKPHYRFHCYLNWREIKVDEPGMLSLFVKFYWALSHSFDDAEKILLAAHKEQGYGYYLDKDEGLESNIDLTKQMHPNQTSQIGDDTFQSLSKEAPGSIRRDIEFQKNHSAKKDAPNCPEREGKSFSPSSLDFASLSLSVTRQSGSNPSSSFSLPPESRNTAAICDLPKKRKRRQVGAERRSIKHRKINEASLDTSKLCNLSQIRYDVIDEKTKARPSQLEDKADHVRVSHAALCGQPPFKKLSPGLKFQKNPTAKKDVPDYLEREGKRSQTCPPSLDPTSLSLTREIGFNSSALPLPPDSQDTTGLPKSRKRKRQTSLDTPRKRHWGINEATSNASKLGDNNNLEPHPRNRTCHFEWKEPNKLIMICRPVASSTSESTKIELDESVLLLPSNPPVPTIHDPQRGVEAHPVQGKQKSRSNSRATKKTSVLTPRPKDATRQPKEYETTSNPKKRRASNSDGVQHKGQEVPVDQEDSVPVVVQPDLAKKRRGRPPKVREEQEGSASVTVKAAPRKRRGGQPKKVKEGQETSITSGIPPAAQSSHAISGLQEIVEGSPRNDHVSCRGMKEETNHSENWIRSEEHEEDFDCEDPAVTQMEDCPTNISPTHKLQLPVNPPIWAQVCDTTL